MSNSGWAFVCCSIMFAALVVEPAHSTEVGYLNPAEAAIPNSRVIHFTSTIDKEPYTLQISIPIFAPPPKAGYPVIYVLDGEIYFPSAAIASDFLADKSLGDKAAVVVGIGHDALNNRAVIARYARKKSGGEEATNGSTALNAFQRMRDYDFKWSVKNVPSAPALIDITLGHVTGGVDTFLQVIEKEIKPRVEALAPIDKSNQALFGHSLGGLAVVHALFTEPNAFRSFIAGSPSLYYDSATLLRDEKRFAAEVSAGRASPRVLITVGALEPDNLAPTKELLARFTPEQRAEFTSYGKTLDIWPGMITRARALAGRLKALNGKPPYDVKFTLFPDQNHQYSAYPATIRAIRFAFLEK